MDGRNRADIKPGMEVDIVLKADQRTGKLTRGIVKDILTKSPPWHQGPAGRRADRPGKGHPRLTPVLSRPQI